MHSRPRSSCWPRACTDQPRAAALLRAQARPIRPASRHSGRGTGGHEHGMPGLLLNPSIADLPANAGGRGQAKSVSRSPSWPSSRHPCRDGADCTAMRPCPRIALGFLQHLRLRERGRRVAGQQGQCRSQACWPSGSDRWSGPADRGTHLRPPLLFLSADGQYCGLRTAARPSRAYWPPADGMHRQYRSRPYGSDRRKPLGTWHGHHGRDIWRGLATCTSRALRGMRAADHPNSVPQVAMPA